jgi:hypothetical protein
LVRHITSIPLSFIYLLALVLNVYLLFSAADGARIVQQVEADAGRGLNCEELYRARAINAYFDTQRPMQAETLYLFNLTWPIWLALSIGISFGLTAVIDLLKRWRWLLIFVMVPLVILLIFYLPTIAKISCAID